MARKTTLPTKQPSRWAPASLTFCQVTLRHCRTPRDPGFPSVHPTRLVVCPWLFPAFEIAACRY